MLRAAVACAVALVGPAVVYVASRSPPSAGCSTATVLDGATVIPIEVGVDTAEANADAARTDGRIFTVPWLDAGEGDTSSPL